MSKDCGSYPQLKNSRKANAKHIRSLSQPSLLDTSSPSWSNIFSIIPGSPSGKENERSPAKFPYSPSAASPFLNQNSVKKVGTEEICSSIEKTRLFTDNPEDVHKLPVLTHTSHSEFKCIDSRTLVDVLNNKYDYKKVIIIDCRFDYEYSNGHIQSAENFSSVEKLSTIFLSNPEFLAMKDKICLIFHCEYSSHRAPKAYRYLRKLDRNANVWPNLNYPEMYLLDGGYKKFYSEKPDFCVGSYVEMRDPNFATQLRQAAPNLGKLKTKSRYLSRSCQNLPVDTTPVRNPSFANLFAQTTSPQTTQSPYR